MKRISTNISFSHMNGVAQGGGCIFLPVNMVFSVSKQVKNVGLTVRRQPYGYQCGKQFCKSGVMNSFS